jgi:myo-inositol-1(or 4)-monophosphatase
MTITLSFAKELAQETGSLLCNHFTWSGIDAKKKADSSVVTAADIAADQLITNRIQEEYPDDSILSEELNTDLTAKTESVWIVDPLDGTTNFSLGLPIWGVSIARLTAGKPTIAAVYFPIFKELYSAETGKGAFLNEVPINVKPFDPEQPAAFFSCCTRTHRRYRVDVPYKMRILGSAAFSLCMVARGSALLAFEATPKIWDLAGGWLLVQEAGGVVESHTGSPLFPLSFGINYSQTSFPTVAAASLALAKQAHQQIQLRDH